MSRITLTETTASGVLLNTYVVTPTEVTPAERSGRDDHHAHSSSRTNARIDVISPEITTTHGTASETTKASSSGLSISSLRDSVLAPFLPVGYPDSVSPDYTSYQRKSFSPKIPFYDSLQAALSTIASLLASRAVLTTLGVGSADATTALAINLSIFQTTISNISSILFAHRFATAIAQDVKFYRFFADIVNDTAFVLDVLSHRCHSMGVSQLSVSRQHVAVSAAWQEVRAKQC
ncbi:RUS1 family protein C16orf58 [Cyphellophora attinorum]|uniref:RUS1 family protein C16orf58 n=1 Tax=Cyphellophora attinorum TaxID=1664694 RepID=A0A0N1HA76_9EURO|nr:RUS1 family protein C16orf58 [Phialophora attinorum]KPI44684.1 RUS1 family protein C16orf58 [Phialophora attinorum]